jgi:hypothetical protein
MSVYEEGTNSRLNQKCTFFVNALLLNGNEREKRNEHEGNFLKNLVL